ncbi:MAG: tRNA (N6-isopentenyl adenosine(37)-C2)-methylthiotransferase MiaB [Anaerolineae bacterium]|nr:tRNA (N6-isopentenyl adenosine(37)-C2)-methylthiotransferase MiaB [Anaerolineae bacterium]
MNEADTQRVAAELEKLGYTYTDTAEEADVVVLNTCVVRQSAEDKVYGKLGALKPVKAARPDMVISVMGCLVGHSDKQAQALRKSWPLVDVFMGPSETRPLVDFLRARELDKAAEEFDLSTMVTRYQAQDEELVLPSQDRGRVLANVPIMYGCDHVCTFCIIPYRRGRERSRPLDEIEREVRSLARQGVKEVMLLGQIVDRYGYDHGDYQGLPRLLRRLNSIEELERVRFLTSHPNYMTQDLLETVAELPKVMEHINVPVQAGHDETLRRMKRGYTVEDYRRLIERIRATIPNVAVHTDIIVGFCGETDEHFQGTVDLLRDLKLDKVHLAKYSPRPGTVSAKIMADDVPAEEKERRHEVLNELQSEVGAEINARFEGQTVEVLVEGKHKGKWRGRTRNDKLVFFDDPSRDWTGQLAQVEITWTGPWSMQARLPQPRRAEREVIPLLSV